MASRQVFVCATTLALLGSPVQYSTPTLAMSGVSSWARSKMFSTGMASEVPVICPPGASRLSTNSAATGSVTALNTTGMPVPSTTAAALWAAGVAMAMITSTPSAANFWQMLIMVVGSFWPFW